jgi:hypothetical protein
MDLIAYLHPGWAPLVRPAPATRPWRDDTPKAFAYRCLPLKIANGHGWEVLNPWGFEAITIKPDAGGVAFRQWRDHLPHRGDLAHAAGLEPVDRRFAEQA